MNENETQKSDNQNTELHDLPIGDEQAEETKGGTLQWNFAGIEGAAAGVQQGTQSSDTITVTGTRIRRPN